MEIRMTGNGGAALFEVEIVVSKQDKGIVERRRFPGGQDRIVIGRDLRNREAGVYLQDAQRSISRRHAAIERRDNAFAVADTSLNHMWLNDEDDYVTPGEPYPLHSGDSIRIADYVLRFVLEPVRIKGLPEIALDMAQMIERMSEEEGVLREILQREFKNVSRRDGPEVAVLLKRHLPGRWAEIEKALWEDLELREKTRWAIQGEEIHKICYEAFVGLKHGCTGNAGAFTSDRDVARFADRIERVLKDVLKSCADLLEVGTQFERETSTWVSARSATAVDSEESRIKHVLDWSEEEQAETSQSTLGSDLRDVMLHELALLAGYRKAVPEVCRELFRELSPGHLRERAEEDLKGRWWWWLASLFCEPILGIYWKKLGAVINQYSRAEDATFLERAYRYFWEEYRRVRETAPQIRQMRTEEDERTEREDVSGTVP